METLIGRIAELPDGTRVRIEEIEGAIAFTRRIEGANKDIPAIIDLEKLHLLDHE